MKNIYYEVVNSDIGTEDVTNINANTFLFAYPCSSNFLCTPYRVVLSHGMFQIECYGAGNTQYGNSAGGGYTSGIIKIQQSLTLYLYLGAQGEFQMIQNTPSSDETFNCGGGNVYAGHTGSGATDVRLDYGDWKDFSSLRSRIMVAGGAGGSECGKGGAGGGLKGGTGESGTCSTKFYDNPGTGGSNSSGGKGKYNGKFGYVLKPTDITGKSNNVNCGGGGYYGGGSCNDNGAGAGGGSSFISGHPGCDAITKTSIESSIKHTGQSIHYSDISFFSTTMLSGSEEFITPNRESTEIGHVSSGNVVITYLSPIACTQKPKRNFLSIYLFITIALSK